MRQGIWILSYLDSVFEKKKTIHRRKKSETTITLYCQRIYMFWDGRIRTSEQRDQNPLPYHLATPHLDFYAILIKYIAGFVCLSTLAQISIESIRLVFGFFYVFGMCRYRIQLNLLIITYNSIKILYENIIFSILL